ncbi:MAG TPA: hypothetical protein VFR58_11980 [Flavisolibacter sp.]|nr:hypothetical protein [Flavisolibacter sp.]
MVEVFKTNVSSQGDAHLVVAWLKEHFPDTRINFDLQDCDRILRVEGKELSPLQIMMRMQERGYCCTVLE